MSTTKNPKTSILIPYKNAAKYLKPCIASIIDQTEINWEIIAINDHSSDESAQIIDEFCAHDKRIFNYINNGKGIIDGLRMAFEHSTGTLITRMDADDIMAPDKLADLKQILMKSGLGTVATGLVRYFSDGILGAGYQRYANWLNGLHSKDNCYSEIYKECVIPSPAWMVWRSDLISVGAFDSNIYPEDYDLCFRFYKMGFKIVASQQVLHFWRDYPERTSRNDPRLKDQSFMSLKLNRFIELETKANDRFVIWGAGRKGKLLAQLLNDKEKNFSWVCNNKNKIKKRVYNKVIESHNTLLPNNNFKILIAVAERGAQKDISRFLDENGFRENQDYYFFC